MLDPRGFKIQSTSPLAGTDLVSQSNASLGALGTISASSIAPTIGPSTSGALVEGQEWLDTSTTQRYRRVYNGSTWQYTNTNSLQQVFTAAGLPTPSTQITGMRFMISDSSAATPAFWSTAGGGGGSKAPVTCDGTSWRFG